MSDPLETSSGLVYELAVGPYAAQELSVTSFEGSEAMSSLYAFEIIAWYRDIEEDELESNLLGQRGTLTMRFGDGGTRLVHGVVSALTFEGTRQGGRHVVRLTLVPAAFRLQHRVNSRIFQDATVEEIVSQIFGEHGVAAVWSLEAPRPARRYCVQYRESDWAFVCRVLAVEGIFFFFEQAALATDGGDAVERLVVADRVTGYGSIDGDPVLLYRHQQGEGAMSADENHVLELKARTRVESESVVLRDYDFRRPSVDSTVRTDGASQPADAPPPGASGAPAASGPDGGSPPLPPVPAGAAPVAGGAQPLEVYHHHVDRDEPSVDADRASVLLEQLRAGAREAHGASVCRRLLPGQCFELHDHPEARLNARHVVTRVRHRGVAAEGARGAARIYENDFHCVSAEIAFRPPRPAPVFHQVTETAIVVGPPGAEVYTDALGRVRVQFYWDREGQRTEHSSCWIRVAQQWAGAGFGSQFIPRIGTEVIVSFLGGNCDRPIVTGCVHNTGTPTPYVLPQGQNTSGIRTRSTPGSTGFSELSFDDTVGHEHVSLRAERDMDFVVQNDRRESVGGRRFALVSADEIQVATDRRAEIRGDDRLMVEGDLKTDVHGSFGQTIFLNRNVQVRGIDKTQVGGASLTTEGTYAVRVDGDYTLRVGTGEGVAQTNVAGNWIVSTSKGVRIDAGATITLVVGPSSIEVSADGITLKGPAIHLKGDSISVEGSKGPKLSLGDAAEVVSKSLKLVTESASLELDKDAQIKGAKIKLGAPQDKPPDQSDAAKDETKPFKVKLTDEDFQPYAQKHYELVSGGKRFEGSTGGDGSVSADIPKDAVVVEIAAWLDTYPTGRKKSWTVRVAEIPPATAPKGALTRLQNLGYFEGLPGDLIDRSGEAALRWFQQDHDLDNTGQLDAKTASELERVHGG